jgi:NSS family neurotransmitter:Na+ symporter
MTQARRSIHGQWSSRWAFVLAAAGSAVGLGNIWRFPYLTGENGGGAFVLVYLAAVAVVGLPVMMAEVMLGRRGRQSPINTMRTLAAEGGLSPLWQYLGWMGMLAGFLILSFYAIVGGWTVAYVVRSAGGVFDGLAPEAMGAVFDGLVGDPERLLAWFTLFMVMTTLVVSRGVRSGLEQANKVMMPALFLILVVLVGYAMGNGRFAEALAYLFTPDFSRVTADSVLAAMGQAFFSLSLGMGAIMAYGSYLSEHASIPRTTLQVAGMDTLVALLAGIALFPLVFAYGFEPQAGPGLVFKVLPAAFGQMPGGRLVGTLFFVLLTFAAWTSSISLLEPIVAWLVENRGFSRVRAAALAGGVGWVLGLASLLSLNVWSGYTLFGKGVFDLLDFVTANVMLPLGGMLIAVFAGWRLARAASVAELGLGDGLAYRLWWVLIRYVTPVAVLIVLLNGTGLL